MEPEEMNKALEHDAARKEAEAAAQKGNGKDSPLKEDPRYVPIQVVVQQMEDKQALLSKSAALGLIDLACKFTELARSQSSGTMVRIDRKGEKHEEPVTPKPGVAEACLRVVEMALGQAHVADALGDRPLARKMPKDTQGKE